MGKKEKHLGKIRHPEMDHGDGPGAFPGVQQLRVLPVRGLSRMDIDDVPIKANMTHSEWKSIDSICMISMILPSLSNKTMAL